MEWGGEFLASDIYLFIHELKVFEHWRVTYVCIINIIIITKHAFAILKHIAKRIEMLKCCCLRWGRWGREKRNELEMENGVEMRIIDQPVAITKLVYAYTFHTSPMNRNVVKCCCIFG